MPVFRHRPVDLYPHLTEAIAARIGSEVSYDADCPRATLVGLAMHVTGGRRPEVLLSGAHAILQPNTRSTPIGLTLVALDAPVRHNLLDLMLLITGEAAEILVWQARTAIDGHAERAPMTLLLARSAFAAWDPSRLDTGPTRDFRLIEAGSDKDARVAGAVMTPATPVAHDARASVRTARRCLDLVANFA